MRAETASSRAALRFQQCHPDGGRTGASGLAGALERNRKFQCCALDRMNLRVQTCANTHSIVCIRCFRVRSSPTRQLGDRHLSRSGKDGDHDCPSCKLNSAAPVLSPAPTCTPVTLVHVFSQAQRLVGLGRGCSRSVLHMVIISFTATSLRGPRYPRRGDKSPTGWPNRVPRLGAHIATVHDMA